MKSRLQIVAASATAAAALTVGLSACGGSNSNSSDNADAANLVKNAATASTNLTTTHFVLTADGKIPSLSVNKLEGDLQNKPAVLGSGSVDATVGEAQNGQWVFVDGHMYSNLLTGKYVDYGPGTAIYNVNNLFDANKGIPGVLNNMTNLHEQGSEMISGQDTQKISGTVPASYASNLSGMTIGQGKDKNAPVPITVWIQKTGDHELVQVQSAPVDNSTLQLTFSDWGKPVTATKPAVSNPPALPGGTELQKK